MSEARQSKQASERLQAKYNVDAACQERLKQHKLDNAKRDQHRCLVQGCAKSVRGGSLCDAYRILARTVTLSVFLTYQTLDLSSNIIRFLQ